MSDVPDALLQAQRWAKEAISTLSVDGSLLWCPSVMASSSMFSGACYPERSLEYISAARKVQHPAYPSLNDSTLCLEKLRNWFVLSYMLHRFANYIYRDSQSNWDHV